MTLKKVYQHHHVPKVGRFLIVCNHENQLVRITAGAGSSKIDPSWVQAQSLEGEEAQKFTENLEVHARKCIVRSDNFILCSWQTSDHKTQYRDFPKVVPIVGLLTNGRGIGSANRLNPLLLVVPCHRVIGADGTLVGFAGGLPMKEMLLKLESGQASVKKEEPQPKKRKLEEDPLL